MSHSPSHIQDAFAIAYYRWCCAEAKREVESGFSRVRQFNSLINYGFLDHVEQLAPSAQLKLVGAFLKRRQSRAVELLGLSMSEEEKTLLDASDAHWDRFISGWSWQIDEEYCRMTASRKEVRKTVMEAMRKMYGKPESLGGGLWWFTTVREHCVVRTQIDTGGRSRIVEYDQSVLSADRTLVLIGRAAVCSWVGIPVSEWMGINAGQERHVAQFICDVSQYFIDQAEMLASSVLSSREAG